MSGGEALIVAFACVRGVSTPAVVGFKLTTRDHSTQRPFNTVGCHVLEQAVSSPPQALRNFWNPAGHSPSPSRPAP